MDQLHYIIKNALGRYRHQQAGTALGFFWNFIKPLLQIFIYSIVFSFLLDKSSQTAVNRILQLITGILPWSTFATALNKGAGTLDEFKSLLRQKRISPAILVAINTLQSYFDMLIFFGLVYVFLPIMGIELGGASLLIPLFGLLFLFMSYGFSIALAELNILFPDIKEILGFVLQMLFWLSPVLYDASTIPPNWIWLFRFNPTFYFLTSIRGAYLKNQFPATLDWFIMLLWVCISMITGVIVMKKIHNDVLDDL